jgi:formate dehydrogenase subunit gamma
MEREVQKYRKPTRILHWVHAGAFVVLFLTGLVLFIPPLGPLAQDGWTRLLHRVAAFVFIIAPLIYMPINWKTTLKGLKEAFTWGVEDLGWLKAAPGYYFLSDEKAMPPQGHMNTGQKVWWLLVVLFGPLFVITGAVMWFGRTAAPSALIQWMLFVHNVAFVVTGVMFFIHIYMSIAHPLVRPLKTGAWSAMARGKVSVDYARSHHGKWYEEITRRERTTAR